MKKYIALFIINLLCENGNLPPKINIEIYSAWKMVALTVNSVENGQPITIDSGYSDQNIREIILRWTPKMRQYLKVVLFDGKIKPTGRSCYYGTSSS